MNASDFGPGFDHIAWLPLAAQAAMGFSLAACAGLRAFLPLLAIGAAGRLGAVPLGAGFVWLGSTEALVILSVAAVIEILGDKIPVVDHVLDAAGFVLKPAAGFLLVAAPLVELDPKWTFLIAIAGGSAVAGAVHLGKAKARVISSVGTAGLANPVISAGEDVLSVAGIAIALIVPLLAAAAGLALLVAAVVILTRRLRRPAFPPARQGV